MKKFLIILSVFIMSLVIADQFTIIYGATVNETQDFIYYEDETYNLTTGLVESNINYLRTNRILLDQRNVTRVINLNADTFHHVVFFDENNIYMGYINTQYSTLQLSSYLGYDVVANSFTVPEGATKYALIVYNYEDTRSLTAYTYPSIDAIAWESLTYRDIFEGNNEVSNSSCDNADNVTGVNGVLSIVSGVCRVTVTIGLDRPTIISTPRNISLVASDRIYMSYDYKLSDTGGTGNTITSFMYDGVNTVVMQSGDPVNDFEWYNSSIILPVNNTGTYEFRAYGDYNEFTQSHLLDTDNFFVINMDIFSVEPSVSQLDILRDYYLKYKDISAQELDYNDIFGNDTQYGGSNNLITNGLMVDTDSNGIADKVALLNQGDSTFDTITGFQVHTTNITTTTIGMTVTEPTSIFSDHIYHVAFTVNNWTVTGTPNFKHFFGSTNFEITEIPITDTNSQRSIFLSSPLGDTTIFNRLYMQGSTVTGGYEFGEYSIYDLTDIFGDNTEPDLSELDFDTWYATYTDPIGDYITAYHTEATFITLVIGYTWDDTPAPPPDTTDWINNSLDSVGIGGNSYMLVGLGIALMIVFAIVVGKRTRDKTFVVIGEVVLLFVFTLLGWFQFWIILLLALIVVLITMRNILKGGN